MHGWGLRPVHFYFIFLSSPRANQRITPPPPVYRVRSIKSRVGLSSPAAASMRRLSHMKHKHAAPPVTPPSAARVSNAAHAGAMTPVSEGTAPHIPTVALKREPVHEKTPVLAETAAAAVEASQARWREQRGGVETGDPAANNVCYGNLLPFYYPPGGPGATVGCHGFGVDLGGGGGADGGAFGEAMAAAQQSFDVARMASRRSSIEEALYGSCFKRSSFSAWVRDKIFVFFVALR